MPELPEVENIVRDLKPQLVGRRIVAVQVFWPRTVHCLTPDAFAQALAGRQITTADRRGKYLLFPLDNGQTLMLHLRMTGQLRMMPADAPRDSHTHVVFELHTGERLHYRDMRKFGRFYLVDDPQAILSNLGPEPLSEDFTPIDLCNAIQGRRASIKSLLLDQKVVAGLGNIYADEALFLAAIDPRRPGSSLTLADCSRLHASIRLTLAQAVREGGSTLGGSALSNYRRPVGVQGEYQERHRVFRRTGEPCPVCGTPIERIKLAQRSTHFCPTCQPSDNGLVTR
jgi:formamidopyrimidine-DNA glycosylase